jgi:hypothetical protein
VSDPHVPVSAVPAAVFLPVPGVTSTVTLFNEGTSVVYVGQQGVSPGTGLPLLPGQQVSLPDVQVPLYACSGAAPAGAATATTADASAGATSVSVSSSTGFTAGQQVRVGSGAAAEVHVLESVSGTASPYTFGLSGALAFDHVSGAAVTPVTAAGSSVHATPGVV